MTKNTRKPHTKKKNKKGKGWKITGIAAGAVLLLILCAFMPFALQETDRDFTIKVPRGATAQNVADSLSKYAGDSFSSKTMLVLKSLSPDYGKRHGAYLIPKGSSPLQAARKIAKSMQTPVKITINGFRSIDNLAERVASKGDFTKQEFLDALYDEANLKKYSVTKEQAIGLFLNDTYEIYWSFTPQQVIDKIGAHYLDIWGNPERVKKAQENSLTPAEIVTVASIVDEETNATSEKGRIGRLYINRLEKGMRLQADPTVRFAANDFTIKRVTSRHTSIDSPYNTYRVAGLPPGPIRTTSVATIDSVLNSPASTDIFMCASPSFNGTHLFTDNYESHMVNARRYQAALDSLNIK